MQAVNESFISLQSMEYISQLVNLLKCYVFYLQ